MRNTSSGLLLVNLASLFISTSGILGRLIELPSLVTSFFRCLLAAIFLSLFISLLRKPLRIHWGRHRLEFILSGLFLALHWGTYFYSLQISNVSIAIISLFTYPIITTLIEPIFFNTRFERFNLIISMFVLGGIIILVPEFSLENNFTMGLLIGLLSALLYALRNLFSKKLVGPYPGEATMVYQLLIAGVCLTPSLIYYDFTIDSRTLWLLLALSFVTTTLGHTLFILALKHLSTSTASILASTQPVYAILLAVVILGEPLPLNVILGGVMIITAVVLQNWWSQRLARSKQ